MRINTLLRGDSAVTPEAMRRFQTDPGSEGAEIFVPAFLAAARRSADEPRVRRAASLLSEWDRRYTRENSRAVLYESAMDRLGDLLWDELRPDSGATRLPNPGNALVAILLRDSASAWWDRRETRGVVERRDAILATALAEGLDRVIERFGEPENGGWRWDRVRFATIHHLLYIPALSREGIPLQGGQGTLNPSSADGSFGSSWRMVVELGPTLRAFGIYPGGQSGNPASRRYDDRVSRWSNGELDTLRLPGSPAELGAWAADSIRLSPVR
jgi:penicillin amidase